MDLYYSIEAVNDLKYSFEVVCFSGIKKGVKVEKDPQNRAYSLEVIKSSIQILEKNLFSFLVKEKRNSIDYSRFLISKENSMSVLKALSLTCKLVYRQQLVNIHWDSKGTFIVHQKENSFYLMLDGQVVDQKSIFCLPQILYYLDGAFYFFKQQIPKRLYYKLQQHLTSAEIKDLIEDYQDEIKIEILKKDQNIESSPIPLLKLTDRTGAFANLCFYYDDVCIENSSKEKCIKRNIEEEKLWEMDLLKVGFIRKVVSGSNYYCSLDKVAKALSCLIDAGWEILDTYGRKVVRGNDSNLKLGLDKQTLHIQGKVNFDSIQVDVTDVYGAFCRRQTFLNLGNNTVGLIDHTAFAELVEMQIEMEEDSKKLVVQKAGFFSLRSYFPKASIDFDVSKLEEDCKIKDDIQIEKTTFHGVLYDYQKEGVNWLLSLYKKSFSGLLADDMGLGKTVQVIAFLSSISFNTALIVVPASVLYNWKREIDKFNPTLKVVIFHGKEKNLKNLDDSSIVLTTYGTLRENINDFSKVIYEVLILDEAQTIKNRESQIYQSLNQLKSSFRLSITGTPIENSLSELYAQFEFLLPGLLNPEIILQGEMNSFSKKRIQTLIAPFLLRRKKKQVLKELPEKIEQLIFVDMNEEEINSYESILQHLKSRKDSNILEAILRLRQHCALPLIVNEQFGALGVKFSQVLQDIINIVQNEEKVILYSSFLPVLQLMKKHLEQLGISVLYLDGQSTDRQNSIDLFQNDKSKKVFLISLKAGGVGLNLTAADYVLLYDPWWNEAVENQAIDRAHRIGRESAVIARRYVVKESIEEKIMKLKDFKSQLSWDILD